MASAKAPTLLPQSPYLAFMGLKIEKRNRGRVTMSLQIRRKHRSRLGRLHGGVLAGLVESAGASAAFSTVYPKSWCLTMQVSMNFLASVTSGRLTAVGKVVHHGSRTLVSDVRVTCGGKTIATGTVTSMQFPLNGSKSPKGRKAAR